MLLCIYDINYAFVKTPVWSHSLFAHCSSAFKISAMSLYKTIDFYCRYVNEQKTLNTIIVDFDTRLLPDPLL